LAYTLVIYINLAVVYVDGNTRQFKKIGHQKLKKGDLNLNKGSIKKDILIDLRKFREGDRLSFIQELPFLGVGKNIKDIQSYFRKLYNIAYRS
jgi:hypothetical protein